MTVHAFLDHAIVEMIANVADGHHFCWPRTAWRCFWRCRGGARNLGCLGARDAAAPVSSGKIGERQVLLAVCLSTGERSFCKKDFV